MPRILTILDRSGAWPPPEGANFFHSVQVDSEIEMLVGYIDLLGLHSATHGEREAVPVEASDDDAQEPADIEVVPEITRRILLSMNGFLHLAQRVRQIEDNIRSGLSHDAENDEDA